MASSDHMEEVAVSSEEQHTNICNPCENDGTSIEASHYCPECDDYFCDSCKVSHKRFKVTKSHCVMALSLPTHSESAQAENAISADVLCSCRGNKVSIFCENHADVACLDCKLLKHRDCNTSSIEDKCVEFDESIFETTLQNSTDIKDKLTQFQTDRTDDLQLLTPMIMACKDGITAFKDKVCTEIDMALSSLETYNKNESSKIQQQKDTAKSAMANMVSDQRFFDISKSSGDMKLKFVSHVRLSNKLKETNTVFDELNKEVHKPRILLNSEKAAEIVKGISTSLLTQEMLLQSPKIVAKMHIKSSKPVPVNMSSDKAIPWITGSTFMPSGELVLCDYKNCCVKVFDVNFNAKNKISFPNPVLNVCVLNASEVVVTMPEGKLVQFLEVLPKLERRRCLPLDTHCWGIAVHQGEIYVTCNVGNFFHGVSSHCRSKTGEIRVLDMDGRLKRKLNVERDRRSIFADSYYITLSKQGSIFTTDYCQSVVRCFNLNGNIQHAYQDRSMKNPLGVFVDDGDNVFVCSSGTNNVQTTVDHKTRDRNLLTAADGISEPYSICFRDKDNTLIVTCKDDRLVFVFKLE